MNCAYKHPKNRQQLMQFNPLQMMMQQMQVPMMAFQQY
jgi:hypothetical protein